MLRTRATEDAAWRRLGPSAQRIDPAQPGEAREVVVVGDDGALVLDRERGEVVKRGRGADMEADGVRRLMSSPPSWRASISATSSLRGDASTSRMMP